MKLLPYEEAAAVSNVIVDGARNSETVLTLSHWPKSGSPSQLRADTSTEMVFNYLDAPRFRVAAEAVSNNHFDEDGLAGIFTILHPSLACRHRDLLIDVAQAGDFGVFERRHAARIAFVVSAYADPELSPLPRRLFTRPYMDRVGELYLKVLAVLPRLLDDVEAYRTLWEDEDARLTASEQLIESGAVRIEEQPDLDLALIRLPDNPEPALGACHPFALHTRTSCSRLLLLDGSRAELQYRYEGWVQLASRRPAPRVDLSDLASELNLEETSGGHWVFDGVDQITPGLHLEGSAATTVPIDSIIRRVEDRLRAGPPAWDPYG